MTQTNEQENTVKLIKKVMTYAGGIPINYYKTINGRFTVEPISNASGSRQSKFNLRKYIVRDDNTLKTYKTDTLRDAKLWIGEILKYEVISGK